MTFVTLYYIPVIILMSTILKVGVFDWNPAQLEEILSDFLSNNTFSDKIVFHVEIALLTFFSHDLELFVADTAPRLERFSLCFIQQ